MLPDVAYADPDATWLLTLPIDTRHKTSFSQQRLQRCER